MRSATLWLLYTRSDYGCCWSSRRVTSQRFDVDEELERAGLLHSQQELQIDARSCCEWRRQRYRSGRHRAVQTTTQRLGRRRLHCRALNCDSAGSCSDAVRSETGGRISNTVDCYGPEVRALRSATGPGGTKAY